MSFINLFLIIGVSLLTLLSYRKAELKSSDLQKKINDLHHQLRAEMINYGEVNKKKLMNEIDNKPTVNSPRKIASQTSKVASRKKGAPSHSR